MKAWIKRGGNLVLGDTDEPRQAADELMVRVRSISLNRGEVRGAARAAEGAILGWDVAGVVERGAPNGAGPAPGTPVAALLNSGGWAELVSVPAWRAAVIPPGVDFDRAATLPIAGLTVMRALGVAGSLLGRTFLVTGGSGGVGQLAIQLAAMAGAIVTAVSSNAAAFDQLRAFGASEIVRSIHDAAGPYDVILESAGGSSLAAAIERVARGGVVLSIGNSSEEETTFNARTLFSKGGASIYGLIVFEELESRRIGARDLERLLQLVAAGTLQPWITVHESWTQLPRVLADLKERSFTGKAVLSVP